MGLMMAASRGFQWCEGGGKREGKHLDMPLISGSDYNTQLNPTPLPTSSRNSFDPFHLPPSVLPPLRNDPAVVQRGIYLNEFNGFHDSWLGFDDGWTKEKEKKRKMKIEMEMDMEMEMEMEKEMDKEKGPSDPDPAYNDPTRHIQLYLRTQTI